MRDDKVLGEEEVPRSSFFMSGMELLSIKVVLNCSVHGIHNYRGMLKSGPLVW